MRQLHPPVKELKITAIRVSSLPIYVNAVECCLPYYKKEAHYARFVVNVIKVRQQYVALPVIFKPTQDVGHNR